MKLQTRLVTVGLVLAFAVGMVGVSHADSSAKSATKSASSTKAHATHRGMHHGVVSVVGDLKFETTMTKTQMIVFVEDKAGKPAPVGDAKGTATLTFPDGTTQTVQLAKATMGKMEHLAGPWTPGAAPPTQAAVQISGLPGATAEASYTVTLPQMKHHEKGAASGSTSPAPAPGAAPSGESK